jgi:peptidoglycan L-alanyl-D-glutamate endopeptidase CwlK
MQPKGIDSGTLAKMRCVYPDIATRTLQAIQTMHAEMGVWLRATEALRTMARQAEYYASGRTKPGTIITWALPGDSFHHYGLAVDLCFRGNDPYPPLNSPLWGAFVRIFEENGFDCGFKFPKGKQDAPHVQKTYGLSLTQIKQFYKEGGITKVFSALDKIRGVPHGQDWLGPVTNVRLLEFDAVK